MTKISNEDGNVFKMAAKRRSGYEIPPVRKNINKMADALHTLQSS